MIKVTLVKPDGTKEFHKFQDSDLASLFNMIGDVSLECDRAQMKLVLKITAEKEGKV